MEWTAKREGVMTEADTCREFVTPRLVEAGWSVAPHVIGEQRMRLLAEIEDLVSQVER